MLNLPFLLFKVLLKLLCNKKELGHKTEICLLWGVSLHDLNGVLPQSPKGYFMFSDVLTKMTLHFNYIEF